MTCGCKTFLLQRKRWPTLLFATLLFANNAGLTVTLCASYHAIKLKISESVWIQGLTPGLTSYNSHPSSKIKTTRRFLIFNCENVSVFCVNSGFATQHNHTGHHMSQFCFSWFLSGIACNNLSIWFIGPLAQTKKKYMFLRVLSTFVFSRIGAKYTP